MSLASERYVVLKNGPTVRVEPVELLLDLGLAASGSTPTTAPTCSSRQPRSSSRTM